MSLDNIQLPSIVIQELFKNSLVQLNAEAVIEPLSACSSFIILGNNRRHILIIVDGKDSMYLPDDQLNFLMGILSACKLIMEDVAVLNIRKNETATYQSLTTALHSSVIILFAVLPEQIGLPLEIPHYQVQQYNKQTYLLAPSLPDLAGDKREKGKLWDCLKKIFSIQ